MQSRSASKPLYTHLYFQVLVAIAIGVLLGFFFPAWSTELKPLGDAFIKLIKMIIAPIIFTTVVVGIAKIGDMKKVGRVGLKAIIYFEVITTLALGIGLLVVNLVRPGDGMNVDPNKIDTLTRIQNYHMQLFAYYLNKLQSTKDGDGSLLDHTLILYGSNMSSSNLHNHFPLPVVLAGGAAGAMKGNRHLKYTDETPMTNLLMSMLGKVGVVIDKMGDSTGTLADL